jgi:WD40 repeat protein
MSRRFLTGALLVFSNVPLHAQSEIELPKPNTGALGIHFKLVQSVEIPVSHLDYNPDAFFTPDSTGIIVSSMTKIPDEKGQPADRVGIKLDRYNWVSGNYLDTLGIFRIGGYCVSADSSLLASVNMDDILQIFSVVDHHLKLISSSRAPVSFGMEGCAFSPDRAYLAVRVNNQASTNLGVEASQEVQLWNVQHAAPVTRVATSDYVADICFTADSKLVTVAQDGVVQTWSIPAGQPIVKFSAEGGKPVWAKVLPDQKSLAVILTYPDEFGRDKGRYALGTWDLNTSTNGRHFDLVNDCTYQNGQPHICQLLGFSGACLSPDGQLVLTAEWEQANVWLIASGTKVTKLSARDGAYGTCRFSPDGKLATAFGLGSGAADRLLIWRVERY